MIFQRRHMRSPDVADTLVRAPARQLIPDDLLLPGGVELRGDFVGGDVPPHWVNYLNKRMFRHPMGKPRVVQSVPDPRYVYAQVSEPQNLVSGGSGDPWRAMFSLTTGAMRNGYNPASSY